MKRTKSNKFKIKKSKPKHYWVKIFIGLFIVTLFSFWIYKKNSNPLLVAGVLDDYKYNLSQAAAGVVQKNVQDSVAKQNPTLSTAQVREKVQAEAQATLSHVVSDDLERAKASNDSAAIAAAQKAAKAIKDARDMNPDNYKVSDKAKADAEAKAKNDDLIIAAARASIAGKNTSPTVLGASCPGASSNIGDGQYAQSGRNATEVKGPDGKLGTTAQRECVKCQDGVWTGSFICGEGEASNYITRPDEVLDCRGSLDPKCAKVRSSCWSGGTWYADSPSQVGTQYCNNGNWVDDYKKEREKECAVLGSDVYYDNDKKSCQKKLDADQQALLDITRLAQEFADKKQACEQADKKWVGTSCMSSSELGRLVHTCEEKSGMLFNVVTGVCGPSSAAVVASNASVNPSLTCGKQTDSKGNVSWVDCTVDKQVTMIRFCSGGTFDQYGKCNLPVIQSSDPQTNSELDKPADIEATTVNGLQVYVNPETGDWYNGSGCTQATRGNCGSGYCNTITKQCEEKPSTVISSVPDNAVKKPAGSLCGGTNLDDACASGECKLGTPANGKRDWYCMTTTNTNTEDIKTADGTVLVKNGSYCNGRNDMCASGFCEINTGFLFGVRDRCADNPFTSSPSNNSSIPSVADDVTVNNPPLVPYGGITEEDKVCTGGKVPDGNNNCVDPIQVQTPQTPDSGLNESNSTGIVYSQFTPTGSDGIIINLPGYGNVTSTQAGCGPMTVYNYLQSHNRTDVTYDQVKEKFNNPIFWSCSEGGCGTGMDVVAVVLEQFDADVGDRIVNLSDIGSNPSESYVWGGTLTKANDSTLPHVNLLNNCTSSGGVLTCDGYDSAFSGDTPSKCVQADETTMQCNGDLGSFKMHVGETDGNPDSLYPVESN